MNTLSGIRLFAVLMGLNAVGAGACASTAPRVKSTMQAVPPGSAVVVGKFGVYNRFKLDSLFWELQAVSLQDGKKWNIPLPASDVAPDGNSVPFFLELPPGVYLLTKWSYTTSRANFSGENAGVLFELPAGRATCIGGIYMGSRGTVPNTHGSSTQFKSGIVLMDDCEQLGAEFKKRAPLLSPPEKKLALGADKVIAKSAGK